MAMMMRLIKPTMVPIFWLIIGATPPMMNFEDAVTSNGAVRMTGWARIHGELMLFRDEASMYRSDIYSKCVSARFGIRGPENLRRYDRKKIEIVGATINYDTLPEDDAPLLKRKLLDGLTIPNFCLGKKVILLSQIKILSEKRPGL